MNNRLIIINKLINNPKDLDIIEKELNKFEWDYILEKVILSKNKLKEIFLNNLNNYNFLSYWANIIELRDEIEYEKGYESNISEIINILANPEINGILTKKDFFDILNKVI